MKKPVMVIGGGIAGIQAASDLALMGIPVILVEESPSIGGRMAQLDKTFPTNDCSACIFAPKVTACYNHPLVKSLVYSDVVEIKGDAPDFTVVVKKKPRFIDENLCTGCSDCFSVCPVVRKSEFDMGMGDRKAIYKPFVQAVPNIAVIDGKACVKCGKCEEACLAKAVRLNDQEKSLEIKVAAVIFCAGCDAAKDIPHEFGYGRFKDVITSVEYERILSSGGPCKGSVERPSDKKAPERIAFIQCAGSRDSRCENEYCSSVCCMYAVKEAIITKEHLPGIENIDIFYMDMRAFGKDFDKYVDLAKDKYGVRFIKSRIGKIEEDKEKRRLIIEYAGQDGGGAKGEYDMAVLSTGMKPKEENIKLLGGAGVKTDKYGFISSNEFDPTVTSRAGIYACGVSAGPKDIPETVTEASAAASASAKDALFGGDANSDDYAGFFSQEELPQCRDISKEPINIGVFLCHCGVNIGGYVSIDEVLKYTKTLPFVEYAGQFMYSCSMDAQKIIADKIVEAGLNRIVVASCSPRTHEPLFREVLAKAGLNPYLLVMANIRDQCSWVHMDDKQGATYKAKELVRMAVGRVTFAKQLVRNKISVAKSVLVIGGGAAGMAAATDLADTGYKVHLIERSGALGGNATHICTSNLGRPAGPYMEDMIERVYNNPLITVYLDTAAESANGFVGNFKTTVKSGGFAREIEHGAVIIAAGANERKPDEYLYGKDGRVVTMLEFEDLAKDGFAGFEAKKVVMIQCVGSREEGREYCSRVCCNQAVKNALLLKDLNEDIDITILYRDIRTYGLGEQNYREARRRGIRFIRYDSDAKPEVRSGGDSLLISVFEPVLYENIEIRADKLVLGAAIVPDAENNRHIAQMYKVPLNQDGFFLEAHVKLAPVDFAAEGVYLCGLSHSPKTIKESILQGRAAAGRAMTVISKDEIETEGAVAVVDPVHCSACGACEAVCAYNAIEVAEIAEYGTAVTRAVVNEALCKGCGTCSAVCRCGALDINGFSDRQVLAEIEYLLRRGAV